MLENNFIINPYAHLMPSYRISPFITKDIITNKNLSYSNSCNDYFEQKFNDKKFCYTVNGRQAINLALSSLNIKKDDCVTIFTTTNNFYISSCVTNEIEKFCKWSRKIEKNTKVIFVNHEFGFPYEDLMELKKYDLPIIEDCAQSFISNNAENSVGKVGDFVIYSLSKYFPLQMGGILSYNKNIKINNNINIHEQNYIEKVVSFYINDIDEWAKKRISNYKYIEEKINVIGLKSRFKLKDYTIPGVYMFKVLDNIDANLFKEFLYSQGIENSVFYKENAMFMPVHNRLNTGDLDYFVECIKYFMRPASNSQ